MGWGTASAGTPRAAARLPSGSASTAITARPSAAKSLASAAAKVVLPTPPLPTIANFIETVLISVVGDPILSRCGLK